MNCCVCGTEVGKGGYYVPPPPHPTHSFFTAQSENGSHSSTVIYDKNLAAKELIAITVLETITS